MLHGYPSRAGLFRAHNCNPGVNNNLLANFLLPLHLPAVASLGRLPHKTPPATSARWMLDRTKEYILLISWTSGLERVEQFAR